MPPRRAGGADGRLKYRPTRWSLPVARYVYNVRVVSHRTRILSDKCAAAARRASEGDRVRDFAETTGRGE